MRLDYPIIINWSIIHKQSQNPYLAPEQQPAFLCGKVYGSKKFEGGTLVQTSPIKRMFREQDAIIVDTMNSRYMIREKDINDQYNYYYNGFVWESLIQEIEGKGE